MRWKSVLFTIFFLVSLTNLSLSQQPECTLSFDSTGKETSDCPQLHNCINNICVHKDIFPLSQRELIGSFLIMILGGLCNSGGLGGGSLLSPILLTFFKYDTTKTIMIVYILIFGGSLGNFLNVFKERDPKTKKPLIIYDLALLVMPTMVIGTHLGILVNQVLAPIITIICLIFVLYSMLRKIYTRAKVTYSKEKGSFRQPLLEGEKQNPDSQIEIELTELEGHRLSMMSFLDENLDKVLAEDNKLFPKRKISLLLGLLVFVSLTAYLKGTDELDSVLGIPHCSAGYWGFFLCSLIGCYIFFLNNKRVVAERLRIKKESNVIINQESYHLNDDKEVIKLGLLGAGAGFLAGGLGIGGGIILGPTLLSMGVSAQSLAATVGFFVVQTSFVSLFQSFLYGGVSYNELIYFLLISSVGSFAVSFMLTKIVNKFGRPSLILFLLAGVLFASMVTLPFFTVWKTYQHPEEMFSFRSLC